MCERRQDRVPSTCQPGVYWGQKTMDSFSKRRVTVASCWASARIALLDNVERYEDSYAITQEFREWITSSGEHPKHLEASVLMIPKTCNESLEEETTDTDEVLEI